MTTARKLGAFSLALAATFGVGAAIGQAVGPIDVGDGDHDRPTSTETVVSAPPDGHGH